MKKDRIRLILIAILFIVIYWAGDSILLWLFKTQETSYWQNGTSKTLTNLCLTDISPYTITSRIYLSILITTFGLILFLRSTKNSNNNIILPANALKSFFWHSEANRQIFTNETYNDLFGQPNNNDCLSKFLTIIHKDDFEHIKSRIALFNQNETDSFEEVFRIIGQDKSLHWLSLSVFRTTDKQTGLTNITGLGEDITKTKEQEQALKEIKEQTHLLFDKMHSGFALHELICDEAGKPVDYRFLQINSMFEKITGLKAENIINKTAKTVLPQLEKYWLDTYAKVALEGTPITFTNYTSTLKRYYEVSAYCPRPGFFACTFNDISERIKAENHVKENEARFRTILENMPIMLDAFDENNNTLFWNKECERVTGYSSEEVIDNNIIWKLLYPNKAYRENQMKEAEDSGYLFRNMEWHLNTKDNEKKTVLWSNISKQHPIPGWKHWAVGIDITEQKITERNLKQQLEMERIVALVAKRFAVDTDANQAKQDIDWALEQIGNFFNVQHCVLFIVNKTGKRLFISNEWCDEDLQSCKTFFRYLPGKVCNEFNPDELSLHWDMVEQLDEKQFLKNRCQDYWIEEKIKSILLIPIFRQKLFVGFITLESIQKQTELDNNMASLIQLFAELVGDLLERIKIRNELTEAKNKAIESDRLKTEFLANISHEIRTPLNGILGFIEIIANQDFPQESKDEYLKIINNCAQQLVSLISDLIDISKISCGQLEVTPIPVAINQELQRLMDVYSERKSQMGKNKIKLICTKPMSDKKAIIETDLLRFHQILNNLLANALKFTEEGFIEFGYAPRPNNHILFYVKDTGIGIPEKMQNLVFDRFTQVDGSHKRKFSGTGLGLHICKQLLSIMDGEIWAESEENKGTTFFFTLPYTPTALETEDELEYEDQVKMPSSWEKKTILIVDDIPYLHVQMKEIFAQTGARILNAYNGEEAIEICEKEKSIDLFLMDIQMPVMSGIDAIQEIKKIFPNTPIIAQTAHAIAGDKERFLASGFDDYIAKPFRKNEILSKVAYYLG